MKKGCMIVALVLTMLAISVSCGGKAEGSFSGGESRTTPPEVVGQRISSDDTQVPKNTAKAIIGDRENWNLYRFGGAAYNVWDSEVLPAFFPKEIEGVKVDQTGYKGIGDESMIDDKVGNMRFSDSGYEEWNLSFYSTEEQFRRFLDELAANGFVGGMTDNHPLVHEFVGNDCYLFMRVNDGITGEEGYTCLVMCSMTPLILELPRTFRGTLLPQVGAVLVDYATGGRAYGYDAAYDDVEIAYDFLADKGTLPTHYHVLFEYVGTTVEDARSWFNSRLKDGWTMDYESGVDDGAYHAVATKGDLFMRCTYGNRSHTLLVGFATMMELLE